MSQEPFLTRWSRRKLGTQHEDPTDTVSSPADRPDHASEPAPSATAPAEPELPSLDSINLETGIANFFRPQVEEGLRRMALKKLFSDPHFNTMDGLDVYIDDYSRPDPIAPDILERLVQAQTRLPDQNARSVKDGEPGPQPDAPTAAPITNGTMAEAPEPGGQDQGQREDEVPLVDRDLQKS